jgi:hypothetical protein
MTLGINSSQSICPHGKLEYICVFANSCQHIPHSVWPNWGGSEVSYIDTLTLSRRAVYCTRSSKYFLIIINTQKYYKSYYYRTYNCYYYLFTQRVKTIWMVKGVRTLWRHFLFLHNKKRELKYNSKIWIKINKLS